MEQVCIAHYFVLLHCVLFAYHSGCLSLASSSSRLHPPPPNAPRLCPQVIEAAERDGAFEQLVLYLRMARVEVKEAIIENELIYSLAKTNALGDLEEIIAAPNVANIEVRFMT